MNKNNISFIKTIILLIVFTLIGFYFRTFNFDKITFGYDQARDLFMAMDIAIGDHIKIVGPNTDIFGLNHGVLYWYLLAPIVYFFKGNVFAVKYFLIFINLLGVFGIYYIAKNITENKYIGLIAAFIYAISYEMVLYARWISNPSPAAFTTLFVYYSYWLIIKNNKKGYLLFSIFWPLSVHFEFFLIYHLFFIIPLLWYKWFVEKNRLSLKEIVQCLSVITLIYLPFIAEQVKFHFRGIVELLKFSGKEQDLLRSFSNNLLIFLDRMVNTIYLNILGVSLFISGLVFISLIITCSYYLFFKKNNERLIVVFLFFWLISPFILFSFEKNVTNFISLGSYGGGIILISYLIFEISNKINYRSFIYIALAFVLVSNSKLLNKYSENGEELFSVQKKILLSDELKVMDFIYKDSKGKVFAINTISNPLFINTTWAYLFNWYGKNTYGYMPHWAGYPQEDVFGGNITLGLTNIHVKYAAFNQKPGTLFYLIIEPTSGIPEGYVNTIKKFEDYRTKILEEKIIGNFVVQKRVFIRDFPFLKDDIFRILKFKKTEYDK